MEYRKRCKVCGKIWCYTDADLGDDAVNNVTSAINAIGGIASAFGGTIFHQQYFADRMENDERKRTNRNQCPNCHSLDSENISAEEWENNHVQESFAKAHVSINSNATTDSLLKRAKLLLEDKDWASANAYCENVLDMEPENSTAYLYKLMAELRMSYQEELKNCSEPFDGKGNYQKVIRFADESLKNTLQGYVEHINIRNEEKRLEDLYRDACARMAAGSIGEYETAALRFSSISDYKDSAELRKKCLSRIEEIRAENSKQKKKRQMAILIAIPVVLALIFGAYRLKVHMDAPAKQALTSALVGTSWQNYFTALDGKYEDTETMTFVDAETIMETHKVKDNGKSKTSEYTNSWYLKSVSSNTARMVTERTSGTLANTSEYTIVFQNKDGNYQISKIVYGTDPDDTDLVFRRR